MKELIGMQFPCVIIILIILGILPPTSQELAVLFGIGGVIIIIASSINDAELFAVIGFNITSSISWVIWKVNQTPLFIVLTIILFFFSIYFAILLAKKYGEKKVGYILWVVVSTILMTIVFHEVFFAERI